MTSPSTTTGPGRDESLGQRIVWARRQAGISQERLAGLIGTSRRHMIRIEKDKHRPGPTFVARIAEATGQPPEYFEAEDEDEESERVSLDDILRAKVRVYLLESLQDAGVRAVLREALAS